MLVGCSSPLIFVHLVVLRGGAEAQFETEYGLKVSPNVSANSYNDKEVLDNERSRRTCLKRRAIRTDGRACQVLALYPHWEGIPNNDRSPSYDRLIMDQSRP